MTGIDAPSIMRIGRESPDGEAVAVTAGQKSPRKIELPLAESAFDTGAETSCWRYGFASRSRPAADALFSKGRGKGRCQPGVGHGFAREGKRADMSVVRVPVDLRKLREKRFDGQRALRTSERDNQAVVLTHPTPEDGRSGRKNDDPRVASVNLPRKRFRTCRIPEDAQDMRIDES